MKICNKCSKEKPLSSYTPSKTGKFGVVAVCKECKNEYAKAYRFKNSEHINIRRKEVPSGSPEKKSEYDKRNWEKHGEKYNERRRNDESYKDRERARKSIDRKNHPDKYKVYYRQANSKRRSSQTKLENNLPKNYMKILLEFYGYSCMNPLCEKEITKTNYLTHDHVIPITWENSSHDLKNSQILCRSCNSSKGNRHSTDYRNGKILFTA